MATRMSAGKLIDNAGLKGLSPSEGASVSRQHANFIITEPSATARHVMELMQKVRERVSRTRLKSSCNTEVVIWSRDPEVLR